jgi:fatty-acyl-CoA synthase/long-chain acyl-CoA synthetase
VPSRWFLAGELPATPTGKVQKFRLAELVGTPALREISA